MSKLLLSVLLVHLMMSLPVASSSDDEEEEDEDFRNDIDTEHLTPSSSNEDDEDNEEDEEEVEENIMSMKVFTPPPTRKYSIARVTVQRATEPSLECYSCSFKRDQELNACLDPVKYKVQSQMCHGVDDQCFTSVAGESPHSIEMIVRGCRSACVDNEEWQCCEKNLCNKTPYAKPIPPDILALSAELSRLSASKAKSEQPPTVLWFVTVLLLLQTVVKVTFV